MEDPKPPPGWFDLYLEAHKNDPLFNKEAKHDEEMPDLSSLQMGASVPKGETILVPPDQLYMEVQCNGCGVTRKVETRFKGVYTCGACQWKGLAPLKDPESPANRVVTEEEKSKEGRKVTSTKEPCRWCAGKGCLSCKEEEKPAKLTTTTKESMVTICSTCYKPLTLPYVKLGTTDCVSCQKHKKSLSH